MATLFAVMSGTVLNKLLTLSPIQIYLFEHPVKSLFLNLAALALFSAFAAAGGFLTAETLLFQLAAQWLVNEIWFAFHLVPALLMQLFGRKGEGREEARQRRAARWTSFCLLLFPALLYGLLSLVEGLTSNALSDGLGLPLGSQLYLCSYAGFGLLFILSLFTGAAPLSVQAVVENFMDDKIDDLHKELRAEARAAAAAASTLPPVPTPAAVELPEIPLHHSRLFAAHEKDFTRKLQDGEQLLLATAPAEAVSAGDEGLCYLFGGIFSAAGLFLLFLAHSLHQSGELTGLVLGAVYLMGAVFLLIALPVLATPLRQRRSLLTIDYFITNHRLLIYRGSEVHVQAWHEPCACYLTPRAGTRGDVAVIRKGMGYQLLRGFFKRWAGLNEEEMRHSFDKEERFQNGRDMQTQALINVEEAHAIHALIKSLLAEAQQKQERR